MLGVTQQRLSEGRRTGCSKRMHAHPTHISGLAGLGGINPAVVHDTTHAGGVSMERMEPISPPPHFGAFSSFVYLPSSKPQFAIPLGTHERLGFDFCVSGRDC